MKKLLCCLGVLLLVLGIFSADVFAATETKENHNGKVLVSQKEVKDLKTLFKKAKKDVHEDKGYKKRFNSKAVLKGKKKGLEVETFSTSQLLEKKEKKNGEVVETYKATTFAVADMEALRSTGGSKYGYDYDSSGSVRAYNTFYYTLSSIEGDTHIDLSYGTGGWDVLQFGASVTGKRVTMNQYGGSLAGCGTCNDTKTIYPGYTFTIYDDPNWIPVTTDQYTSTGISQYGTVNLGSGSWDFTFHHRY